MQAPIVIKHFEEILREDNEEDIKFENFNEEKNAVK